MVHPEASISHSHILFPFQKFSLISEGFCRPEKSYKKPKSLNTNPSEARTTKEGIKQILYSQTVTRAPGSIDNELHKSEKNRERNNVVLHFPLVLPIAGFNTRTQRQNRENLAAMPYTQISIDYFVTSLCREFLRCCSLVVGLISLITAVIKFENYANQS